MSSVPSWLRAVESERLRLVPAQVEHADAFADAAVESDRELSRWSRQGSGARDRASYAETALERANPTASGELVHRYAFTRDLPERLVGGASLQPWRDPRPGAPARPRAVRVDTSPDLEIGCWCRTTMVGRGYASEAVSALVVHAFEDLRATAVWVRTAEKNLRARRLADRLAFVEVERVGFPASPEWGEAATVLIMRRER